MSESPIVSYPNMATAFFGDLGENIRQTYDIMNYTEINNIPGLLLVYFEKAFDSLSRESIFKVLDN